MLTPYEIPPLAIGDIQATVTSTVTEADTAQTLGSGDVPVLGTPRVLALAEAACVSALTRRMPTSLTSVGTRVHIEHLAPIGLGSLVIATAILKGRDGRRLEFDITVNAESGATLATGNVERMLLDRDDFLERIHNPRPQLDTR